MIWSHNKEQTLKDLQRQLAILLFPVALSATGLNLYQYKNHLLALFGCTCVVTVLYLYFDAIHIIVFNGLSIKILFSPAFVNHNFSEPISMHATFMSIYIALSIVIFFYFLLEEKNNRTRILYTIAIATLLAGLVQLASKSVLIALIIFIISYFLFFIPKGTKRIKFFSITLIVLGIILFGITRIGSFKKRYVAELKEDITLSSINNEIPEPRIARWQMAWFLIKGSPIIGYGSGSEKRLLKEKYFENKLYRSFLMELDAHNQYLSFLIKTGILGLLVFFITLFTGFAKAWRQKDIVFASFMILISTVSFSENILDVNKGIFFYAFFFSFLAKSGNPFEELFKIHKKRRRLITQPEM